MDILARVGRRIVDEKLDTRSQECWGLVWVLEGKDFFKSGLKEFGSLKLKLSETLMSFEITNAFSSPLLDSRTNMWSIQL